MAADLGSTPAAARPLNVKDALSYLDRVKVTFNVQEEVYGRFLTIMKDFKTQGIDTPGVIDRVSTLFRGHPALIQGFNTFLPPGYRIECSVSSPQEDGAVTTITVTTPMGMTTRTQVTGPTSSAAARSESSVRPLVSPVLSSPAVISSSAGAASSSVPPRLLPSLPVEQATPLARTEGLQLPAMAPPSLASLSALPNNIATPGAVSLLSSHMAAPSAAAGPSSDSSAIRPPMEFNHAINYVNKIKNRFVRDPETYKSFLEILQTYQKEGRAIQDVYAQVTTLFHAAPDLLDEFKQFLPDPAAEQAQAIGGPASANSVGLAAVKAAGGKRSSSTPRREEQSSAKKSRQAISRSKVDDKGKREGKRAGKAEATRRGPVAPEPTYGDGANSDSPTYPHQPNVNPYPPGYSTYSSQVPNPVYAYEPPPLPPPPQPIFSRKAQASSHDTVFFDRVKSYCGEVTTYHEFLKLLNLYTQDILDLTALVSRAFLFLGQDADLWREFRLVVGWTDGRAVGDLGGRVELVDGVRIVENVPSLDGPRRGKGDSGKGWKTYGPSYRQLPSSEISLNCSGRDALCWDVLNDEWISQPNWASDEGFVAQRKNPYEEALHRSEEERHEYDYHIEANLRTIALLEPIATRIAIMEAEERATFRLKPGLGNQSKSIYQRVIKKVYGKEQGAEVIQALHENPCVAVPIVLARLRQKDDEWKRALREWNRVWREVVSFSATSLGSTVLIHQFNKKDAKNFWKSLDHQAIALKASDKRALTTKALVTEIETIKLQQRQRTLGGPLAVPFPRAQLLYDMADRDTLSDTIKLVFSFLDRTPSMSSADKDKADAFLRHFVPLIFALNPVEWAVAAGLEGGIVDLESIAGTSDGGYSTVEDLNEGISATAKRNHNRKAGVGDLRKKALKNAIGPATRKAEIMRSKVSSPTPSSRATSPTLSNLPDNDAVMSDGGATLDLITPDPLLASEAPRDTSIDEGSTRPTFAESIHTPDPDEISVDTLSDVGIETLNSGTMDIDPPVEVSAMTEDAYALEGMPELIVPTSDRVLIHDVRDKWNCFANSNLYCLVRIFQTLYGRLVLLKMSAVTITAPPPQTPITAQFVPSLSLAATFSTASAQLSTPPGHYYQRALGLCERLFEGAVDQATFEDTLRRMFGTQAYIMFTIDKLCNSVVKLAQVAINDGRSQELLNLMSQDRAHPDRSTVQQQSFYRTQAESAIGSDENLYRIEWTPKNQQLGIQLIGKDSMSNEDLSVAERDWATYVENFVLAGSAADPGVKRSKTFLARNLARAGAAATAIPERVTVRSGLQCKICVRSYRLFFVAHTEDYLHRRQSVAASSTNGQGKARSSDRFAQWLTLRNNPEEGSTAAVLL